MATVGPAKSWRLVHDGSKALLLDELSGYTETMHNVFEAATSAECLAEANRLGLTIPPHVFYIEHDRAGIIAQIKQIRDTKTQTGGYLAAGKWFHSDTFSRTQQIGLVMMGPSIPEGLQWKTMDGSFVTMTPTLASQIFAAAAAQDTALFAHAEHLIAQVNAAADPSTVDITAGWPATYE